MLQLSYQEPHAVETVQQERSVRCEQISVCVCTYQRPKLLAGLIDGLLGQKTHDQFNYCIVVVDNDPAESAREVVHRYIASQNKIKIEYHRESIKGLSYARNKSLEYSNGDYIAIIDDDEVPAEDWLFRLYTTLKEYHADAVFGSVVPHFEVDPPDWILDRKYFYWRDVRARTGVATKKAVTNNVLLRRSLVARYDLKFSHDFAFAGGEDQDFFFRLLANKPDAKYIDCREAVVREFITRDRCNPDYIQRRNLLEARGRIYGIKKYYADRKLKKTTSFVRRFVHSYSRVLGTSLLLPFLLLYKKDLGMECYYKNFYHLGILLALFNISPYSARKSIGLQ